jgi:predicted Fe-Mo cluster-binding NifX family protein
MKIAITAKGTQLTDAVDPRFGRAPYILIVDLESMAYEALDNSVNVNAFRGAGINAATMVADKGVQVLLTGYCGPKAFTVVNAAGIKVVADITGTVAEAIDTFKNEPVQYSEGANVEGHW